MGYRQKTGNPVIIILSLRLKLKDEGGTAGGLLPVRDGP